MYTTPQQASPAERPGVLMAGVVTVFVTVLCTMATALMLITSYQGIESMSSYDTSSSGTTDFFQNYLGGTIAMYALIGLALAGGAVMMLRQVNAGRIVIWVAGGVLAAINLCCGSSMVGVLAIMAEVQSTTSQYDSSSSLDFPTGQVTTATIFNFAAMIAVIIAMILIAQRSVGMWIKGAAPVAPVAGYGYTAPMPGSPIGYQPQYPPQPAPPPVQQPPQYGPGGYQGGDQYGPGSYAPGDQYGPGQQPYKGGDQYGPGQSSGPPSNW